MVKEAMDRINPQNLLNPTTAHLQPAEKHKQPTEFYEPEEPAGVRPRVPQVGSREQVESMTAFEPDHAMPKPRSFWSHYRRLFFDIGLDSDIPTVGTKPTAKRNFFDWLTGPLFPLKPELYTDAYMRPAKCPETFWGSPWRWPNTKQINPKIPPPIEGKYNDLYHYEAFRYWLRKERDVYFAHIQLLQDMMLRCSIKEGVNAGKNCRHLMSKYLAMSRAEELNQSLLYMAVTGNTVIRETPYPADFVEQKRKIYDDWLYRTRMKKPGDIW